MHLRTFLIPFTLLSLCLFSCQKAPEQQAAANQPAAVDEGPVVEIYAVLYDNLRIRQDSLKQSQVITQASEGQFVESMGIATLSKDTATLRGFTVEEPYRKIQTLGADAKEGWMFGGGLQLVYKGPRGTAPELTQLAQLASFLKTLPTGDPASGAKAWEFLQTRFASPASPSEADAAFVLFNRFFDRMEGEGEMYRITEPIEWTDKEYESIWKKKYDMNSRPETSTLARNGFALATGEGMVWPVADISRMKVFFAPKGTPALKAYMDMEETEFIKPAYTDGGIIIPLEELADRAVAKERFIDQYPYFPFRQQLEYSENWTQFELVVGADNTPAFNYETYEIEPDFEKVWAYILKKYPDTRLADRLRKTQALIAANGGKFTDEVRGKASELFDLTW
jgi:hypothetical protein